MSAIAETSKTAMEIYTPIIVGFGAVVLGFLANSLLELLKDNLARNRESQALRRALYFEAEMLRDYLEITLRVLDKQKENVGFYRSRFLEEINASHIGRLTKDEIDIVRKLCSEHMQLLSVAEDIEPVRMAGGLMRVTLRDGKDVELVKSILDDIVSNACALTATLDTRLG